jgi:SPOR domain
LTQGYSGWPRGDAGSWFAFDEDQMGVSGFGPAPHANLDEYERRLRKGMLRTCPDGAPSNAPRRTGSSNRPAHPVPSLPAPAGTGTESTDVSLSLQIAGETSIVDAEDQQALDVEDFRRWWRQRLAQESTQDRLGGRKLKRMAIAFAGMALIGSVPAFEGGAPAPQKTPSLNDIASAQNAGGEIAGAPADLGAKPLVGLSDATPVAPEVDAQPAHGLDSKAQQTTNPEPDRRISARHDGTLLAPSVPSAAERRSPADPPEPPAKPAPEHRNGAAGAKPPPLDLPVRRPGKLTARVVVATTEAAIPSAAADAPTPPLPIGTPVKPERAAGGGLQPIAESGAAPAAPAESAQPPPNPLLRALGNLFGARALPARQSIDPAAIGSTGWAVQLGAPRSEAEAKRDLRRLDARYGSALKGSTVGIRKVLVNGETVYRLHVVGLSKDEAAALCSRVKRDGGSCSLVR